jgi:hypothetical protein
METGPECLDTARTDFIRHWADSRTEMTPGVVPQSCLYNIGPEWRWRLRWRRL